MLTLPGRLVVIYNPLSSRAHAVERRVLEPLTRAGITFSECVVQSEPVTRTAAMIAGFLQEYDTVLVAAGDGTAHAAVNGVLKSGFIHVQIGFLGYGNFNDAAHNYNAFGTVRDALKFLQRAKVREVYPLEITIGEKFFRYGLISATLGWTAKAAARFEIPAVRSRVRTGFGYLPKSLFGMFRYYISSRERSLLPAFRINYRPQTEATDILCINAKRFARIMRTKASGEADTFLLRQLDVRSLFKSLPLLVGSVVFGKMRSKGVHMARLEFEPTAAVTLQIDGEIVVLASGSIIEIAKSDQYLQLLSTR